MADNEGGFEDVGENEVAAAAAAAAGEGEEAAVAAAANGSSNSNSSSNGSSNSNSSSNSSYGYSDSSSNSNSSAEGAAVEAAAAAAAAAPKEPKPRTAGQQAVQAERMKVLEEMKANYATVFGDEKGAPKAKVSDAARLQAIRKKDGEEAYQAAMQDVIARNQGDKFNANNRAAAASAVPKAAPKARAAPATAKVSRFNSTSLRGTLKAVKTRKNAITALRAALAALEAEEEANAGAAPEAAGIGPILIRRNRPATKKKAAASASPRKSGSASPKAKTRKSASPPKAAAAAAKPAAAAGKMSQGNISAARNSLKSAAGVPIPQKIAARWPKWAAGRNAAAVEAKQAAIVEGLKAGKGKPAAINSFVEELGLATREEIEARKAKAAANRARKAGTAKKKNGNA